MHRISVEPQCFYMLLFSASIQVSHVEMTDAAHRQQLSYTVKDLKVSYSRSIKCSLDVQAE